MSDPAIIDRIDAVTEVCAQCGGPLGDSPDRFYCREQCQEDWHAGRPARSQYARGISGLSWPVSRRSFMWNPHTDGGYFIPSYGEIRLPDFAALHDFNNVMVEWVREHDPDLRSSMFMAPAPLVDQPAEDPRDRALRLRRQRNTGPQRRPHAHRGRTH